MALGFLVLITALLQHIVQRITYKSEVARVRKFMLLARQAAWGSKLTGRTEAPRKVKVNIKGNPDVEGEEQEFIPGRIVEMLVQGDEVYLVSVLSLTLPRGPDPISRKFCKRLADCATLFSLAGEWRAPHYR